MPWKAKIRTATAPPPIRGQDRYGGGVGILEVCEDGFAFAVRKLLVGTERRVCFADFNQAVSPENSDDISGIARLQRENERFKAMLYVTTVNGDRPDVSIHRTPFENLTPIYPNYRLHLESKRTNYAMRLIDLIAPIGKGQGYNSVAAKGKNNPFKADCKQYRDKPSRSKAIVLLIDERRKRLPICAATLRARLYFQPLTRSRHTISRLRKWCWKGHEAGGA